MASPSGCTRAATRSGALCLGHHRGQSEGPPPLAPGTKEDTASCTAFFEDLKRRGLPDPLLVVTDGAPGLIRAVDTCFPRALRQRCLVHRCGISAAKRRRRRGPTRDPRSRLLRGGLAGPRHRPARRLRPRLRARPPRRCPCFLDDFDACIAHLRFPLRHRHVVAPPISSSDSSSKSDVAQRSSRTPSARARLEAHVRRRDPRGRPLARPHRRRIRAPSIAGHPRRTRSRSHRAHAPPSRPPRGVPCQVIQQGPD